MVERAENAGLTYSYPYLFRTACTGYFFNNFLPTSIGGDAYRVYRTMPAEGYRSRALSAVLVDRVTGLATLMTLGAVGALVIVPTSELARAYLAMFISGAGLGVGGLLALQFGWLRRISRQIRHWPGVDAVAHNLERLKGAGGAWLVQIVLAGAFQSISIAIVYWLFSQTGPTMPAEKCALVTAAVGIAALLPISINGIGVMEGSFVAMAVALGADYDQALIVALVRRLGIAAMSLLCGLVYLAEGRGDPPAALPRPAEAGI